MRISRALHQRLYLIEGKTSDNGGAQFAVLGSTGNVYDVTIANTANCDCPDHGRSYLCKHILFVLLKVLRVDADSPLVYQSAWLSSELATMLAGWTERQRGRDVLANDLVLQKYAEMKNPEGKRSAEDDGNDEGCRKQVDPDTDCPICFDVLGSEELTYCRVACGTNFHKSCMERWGSTSGYYGSAKRLTCPNCRSPWEDPTISSCKKRSRHDEGYTNLGNLQGQSSVRDTSTYADYYRSHY